MKSIRLEPEAKQELTAAATRYEQRREGLAPLIRGERGLVPAGVQAIIAAWTQKTALVGMLVNVRIPAIVITAPGAS